MLSLVSPPPLSSFLSVCLSLCISIFPIHWIRLFPSFCLSICAPLFISMSWSSLSVTLHQPFPVSTYLISSFLSASLALALSLTVCLSLSLAQKTFSYTNRLMNKSNQLEKTNGWAFLSKNKPALICHCVKLTFCLGDILSRWHFVKVTFCHGVNFSRWCFVKLTCCKVTLCQWNILSMRHFVIHICDIMSAWHNTN